MMHVVPNVDHQAVLDRLLDLEEVGCVLSADELVNELSTVPTHLVLRPGVMKIPPVLPRDGVAGLDGQDIQVVSALLVCQGGT